MIANIGSLFRYNPSERKIIISIYQLIGYRYKKIDNIGYIFDLDNMTIISENGDKIGNIKIKGIND